MTDNISLVGVIATPPKSMQTNSGLSIVSFRLASSQRRYDRTRNVWVDADTNWYTVTAFRQLADHAVASLAKGDRVIVTGRLRVRSWENGERSGIAVEVDAEALGPDLLFGTTTFTRVTSRSSETSAQHHEVVADSDTSPSPVESELPDDPEQVGSSSSEPARDLVGASAVSAPQWAGQNEEAPF